MSLRSVLQKYQKEDKVSWNLIEQDYALSWILKGITSVPELYQHLVFKGGTCLRKCYFGDYRFSQDADFSVQGNYPRGDVLESLVNKACEITYEEQKEKGVYVSYECMRYEEKNPHPDNQEAFTISVQYPWQREPLTRVMIEVTSSEKILLPTVIKKILHPYESCFHAEIQTYQLEEIVSEKVRALLQFSKKLHERGWGRSRARDYYDLWRIFKSYKNHLDCIHLPEIIHEKCVSKDIVFGDYNDLFSEPLMLDLKKSWIQWVSPLVGQLPDLNKVIEDLKREFERLN